MIVSLIAAVGKNRVIGRAGALPWHLPADLRHFKALTMGKPIIMGRRTHESIGKALVGRHNIVISRNPDYRADGASVVTSLAAALALAEDDGAAETMVIGGAEIYGQALARADRLYLTEVADAPEGDVFFPEIDAGQWRETARTPGPADADRPAFDFVALERR